MFTAFGIPKKVSDFVTEVENEIGAQLEVYDEIAQHNIYKVLGAFKAAQISERHFGASTGYGYSDIGKKALGEVYAHAFGVQRAIVSPLVASGTHALTIALFGILRPLDVMLCVTGKPYDTLCGVIGIGENTPGSLADFAIKYQELPLNEEGDLDAKATLGELSVNSQIKMVYIQRSRGYERRNSLTIEQIERFIKQIKYLFPKVTVMVDNCYGEFCEHLEPTDVGADIIVGSLIKNPGGGIAPTGAYFAGNKSTVELIEGRLTAPGIGEEIGSYNSSYLPFFHGIYFSPNIVRGALKGVCLASAVFERLGYDVFPGYDAKRADITQTIGFKTKEELITFVRAIQKSSPVDAHVVPYPWEMPGYADKVIMAAGTFIGGGSIELSADAPIRKPYTAFMQGGLCYENIKLAVMTAVYDLQAL